MKRGIVLLTVEILSIELIVLMISFFLEEILHFEFNYKFENRILIDVIVFLILTFIVILLFNILKKRNVSTMDKRRRIVCFVLLEISNIVSSFLLYLHGLYSNKETFFNNQKYILLSVLCFIVLNSFLFFISPITNRINDTLNKEKYIFAVIIRSALNLFYCFLGYFFTINFGEKDNNFVSGLLFIILFMSSTLCYIFDYLIHFNKKDSKTFLASNEEKIIQNKEKKIFISHSGEDEKYSTAFFELLNKIGVPDSQIFYSSMAENGVPLGEDIYDYLLKQFKDYNLHVIFMLSENYYNSVYCLQEMGAAWVLKHKTDTVLLPTFTEDKIKGSINPNEINIKLDSEEYDLKARLEQFMNEVSEEFEIEKMNPIKWERARDEFIEKVKQISAAK